MRLNEIVFNDARPVEGYGPGFFRIGGQVIQGAVITAPSGIRTWAGFDDIDALEVLVNETDVIFIGTGAEIAVWKTQASAWRQCRRPPLPARTTSC